MLVFMISARFSVEQNGLGSNKKGIFFFITVKGAETSKRPF